MTELSLVLKYLGLPIDYEPSPVTSPLEFLQKNMFILPPHLLVLFSEAIRPKQRTILAIIRNRRLKYVDSSPAEFTIENAKRNYPFLWPLSSSSLSARERPGVAEGREEKEWAKRAFSEGKVGKLGDLLAQYEEERVRKDTKQAVVEDTDDEESFLRVVKERFIYGLLEPMDYDRIDWDDQWDPEPRDAEEAWFDEEDPS